MPFRSKSQARWMFAAESRKELPAGTARQWAHETPSIKALPNKVRKKRKQKVQPAKLQAIGNDADALVSQPASPQQLKADADALFA